MIPTVASVIAMAVSMNTAASSLDERISFNREILPILSNNCYVCHGPDISTRKAGLRLDLRELATGPDGVIVAGNPDASLILERVSAHDPSDRMPPEETGRQLSPNEIQLLRTWIKQGAEWEGHWALEVPVASELPEVRNATWCKNEIDHFILARLESESIAPSKMTDRRTLIRRVTLDLIGLPPTIEEVNAFLADDSPDAYERVVNRLLSSQHFGEHAARPWLDLARYADSQGFEKDSLRTMWRYRDWVINAFNADMPFDQFTLEQIAGDLLPDATVQQQVATGFHRNTQTNTEGGTDDEEFRSAAVIDRVSTTMQGWMGLTAGCAQCHDHKYDPLTQHEFYALYSFFNQTADTDRADDAPFIQAPSPVQQESLDAFDTRIAVLTDLIEKPDTARRAAIESWLSAGFGESDWSVLSPAEQQIKTTNGASLVARSDGSVFVSGNAAVTDTYTVVLATNVPQITALRLRVLLDDNGAGPGFAGNGNFVLNEFELSSGSAAKFKSVVASANQIDYHVRESIDGDAGIHSGWAIAGATGREQRAVFFLETPLDVVDGQCTITMKQTHGSNHVLRGFALDATGHAAPRIRFDDAVHAIVAAPAHDRTDDQWRTLANAIAEQFSESIDDNAARIVLTNERNKIMKSVPRALVMKELTQDNKRTTHLFLGGSFLTPDNERGEIDPGVPDALHGLGVTKTGWDRRDLAEWLVAEQNPLTARVQVNRVWERLFGNGIVATVGDFGVQGERPTHPELLDWLAVYWQGELSYSSKALLKYLVSSATYGQSATVDPVVLKADPRNRLLSRAPRLRLSAEQLRDVSLAVAGLLKADRVGGPSVMPRLPKGMLPQAFTNFVAPESKGADLYRRGIYTQWRRTGHYPTFATFDAPSREYCHIVRERSNTPLQALVMLNDKVFIEAAQGLSRRVLAAHPDNADEAIAMAFEMTLARTPTAYEADVLQQLFESTRSSQATDPEGCLALATDPIGPLPAGMACADAAAMATTCNVLLNLDEFVNRP